MDNDATKSTGTSTLQPALVAPFGFDLYCTRCGCWAKVAGTCNCYAVRPYYPYYPQWPYGVYGAVTLTGTSGTTVMFNGDSNSTGR